MTESDSAEPAPDKSYVDEAPSARAKPLPLRLPIVPSESAPPALVPARMINEVLYCERLFYLEHVQGEWADNVYTADGQVVHRRVNEDVKPLQPAAEAGDDAEEAKPYTARSVWLSSDRLGITAKIDLVEVDGGNVVPVEYKRSKRPDVPLGAYPPELAQICAQVLVLRENGYSCERGEIYYAKDRQRIEIAIDDSLIAMTLRAVERIGELSRDGEIPAPLDNSPKCHGCSLVGICLPDETRALAEEREPLPELEDDPTFEVGDDPWGLAVGVERSVRRMFPARDDRLPVYVQAQGASVRLDGERLIVQTKGEEAKEARLSNTSHVALYGSVYVTTPTLRTLMERGIPVLFFTYGGWFSGQATGNDSKNVELRLAQYAATQDRLRCLKLAQGFVASKILNSRTLLRRNHQNPDAVALSELKQLSRKARVAESVESLLGIEGTAARRYFGEFAGMLNGGGEAEFDLDGRNRRPPRDPVNALLSFCYSLLSKELVLALRTVGLDNMLGFYHRPHFGRASLALDLMEEFRPVIADSVVIGVINNGVVQKEDFIRAAGAVTLTQAARKRVILAFERRMDLLVTHPVFDYRISYRRVLEVQCRLLSRLLMGELPRYPEFRIR
ncbi:MAG TPA: CRISPR-associated endonuclease Cas1 [Polyangiaceae bacterium]|nr:CRISPR-associated endonuclease Cas1 [Polyangiaceae bacterium]